MRFRRHSPVVMCWARRKPAPAKPPASPCRFCSGCCRSPTPASRRRGIRCARRFCRRRANSPIRLRLISALMPNTRCCAAWPFFGGVDMKAQAGELRRGVEILVATPGRLLDHLEQKNLQLGQTGILVLDEADRMLDMGFLPDL